jgi:hypothetical protein
LICVESDYLVVVVVFVVVVVAAAAVVVSIHAVFLLANSWNKS